MEGQGGLVGAPALGSLGMSQVREAEAIGRRGPLRAAVGGLGLLHAFVRGKRLVLQHATLRVKLIAEAQRQIFFFEVQVKSQSSALDSGRSPGRYSEIPCPRGCARE